MSTEKTGILWVPGLTGLLGVREDGAVINFGGTNMTVAALANVAGEFDQFLPAAGKVLTLTNTGTIAGGDAWTLAITAAKTLTVTHSLTLAGTDGTTLTGPSVSATLAGMNIANSGNLLTGTNLGTVTTGATTVAEEHGDGIWHLTKLTCTAFAVGTGADNADLAIGASLYTFPAGTIMVESSSIVGIFDQASHGTITDGEAGLGTVIGSTAVDTLGEVGATSENILNGDTGVLATYVLGTTVVQAAGVGVSALPLTILSAGVHVVYLNLAATWPDIASAELVTFTGVVTLKWRKIS
jgi:hypothetical protein